MFEVFLKRIVNKICFYNGYRLASAKRQRIPSTMQECLERPERPRELWKPFLTMTFLLPIIYYMFYYRVSESRDAGPFSEGILTELPEVVTDVGRIIVKHKTYENDLDKIFTVETHVEKAKNMDKRTRTRYVNEHLPLCSRTVIGNVTVHKELNKSLEINTLFPMVEMGGYYNPPDCHPRHKVAVLVPYRDRKENLNVFLYNIHPFLMRQRLEYRIFVFEQSGKNPFNKGRLFNAGFLEIQRNDDWQCIIFHDVDLLPTTDMIPYTCPILPRHMCATVVEKEHVPTYKTIFGGVTAMTMYQYKKTNGYSNLYWGWGGEDNDMFKRIHAAGLGITRYSKKVGRYISLKHSTRPANPKRYTLLATAEDRYKTDGLSDLRYKMESYASKPLYTHIVIDVDPPVLPDYITEASVSLIL